MKRFFVDSIEEKDGTCVILDSEARHITKVMRMGDGDQFILMNNTGTRFLARIESSGPDKVTVFLEKELPVPPAPPVEIILCQSMLKSKAMDYMIRKTSELGIRSIIPFYSERTVIRLKRERSTSRLRHWNEIARDSAKQSDRLKPAEIESPKVFTDLMDDLKTEQALKIILWEGEERRDIKGLLRRSGNFKKVICVVGPEGGFSPREIEIAQKSGFLSISMGRRILRAETASIVITAVIQYELGDLGLTGEQAGQKL